MKSLQDLIKGHYSVQSQEIEQYKKLVQGQHPLALVISCCDSRIDPAAILHCEPGTLFIARNIANLVHPYSSSKAISLAAAIRYGVIHLKVQHIIVLGHSQCGGIKACLESIRGHLPDEELISNWLKIVKPIAKKIIKNNNDRSNSEQETICEKESTVASLQRLLSYPWIKEKVDQGQLQLHGWYFDLATASLSEYNPTTKCFERLKQKEAER